MRLLREQSSEKVFAKYRNLPEAVKASLWFTICSILQKGISFITVPIFTRMLSTEEYGIISLFGAWQSILTIFATLNLSNQIFNNGMVKYEKIKMGIPPQCLDCLILLQFWCLCFILSSIQLWIKYLNCR